MGNCIRRRGKHVVSGARSDENEASYLSERLGYWEKPQKSKNEDDNRKKKKPSFHVIANFLGAFDISQKSQ